MKNVIVASTNPVKIEAAARGFRVMFPHEEWTAEGVAVPSGVAEQPKTDAETIRGARNRATGAKAARPDGDFWVGMEGGIEDGTNGMLQRAWMAVLSKDGREGIGSTGTFILPERIAAMIRRGVDLGAACDAVFETTNLKQANGTVGMLTGDAIDRTSYYEHAMVLALAPLKNAPLFAA